MQDYAAFFSSHIGQNHTLVGKVCQDNSTALDTDLFSLAVVADGHGSEDCPRSDRGSQFACEATSEMVQQFVSALDSQTLTIEKTRDDIVLQLCKSILAGWNKKIENDFNDNPFTPEEVAKVSDKYKNAYLNGERVSHAYGSTLIFALITKDYFLTVRNGDGQCVRIGSNCVTDTPIPWNEKCNFNVTTSLCDEDAIFDFRYFYSNDIPAAVFIGTDGVDDSFTCIEELKNLYWQMCEDVISNGVESLQPRIEKLLPVLTARGSGDDVSIACIVSPEKLLMLTDYFAEERAKADTIKQQIQERKEREKAIRIGEKQLHDIQAEIKRISVQKAELTSDLSHKSNLLQQIFDELKTVKEKEAQRSAEIEETKAEVSQLDIQLDALQKKYDELHTQIEAQRKTLIDELAQANTTEVTQAVPQSFATPIVSRDLDDVEDDTNLQADIVSKPYNESRPADEAAPDAEPVENPSAPSIAPTVESPNSGAFDATPTEDLSAPVGGTMDVVEMSLSDQLLDNTD